MATQPQWLPHSFSSDGSLIASVEVPVEAHDELTFLNDQHFRHRFKVEVHDRAGVQIRARDAAQGPHHFIFHTALCCSTLLVKMLSVPGRVMGLKEPIILNDLALRTARDGQKSDEELLDLTLTLLARPFDANGTVVTKASNVANRLVSTMLDLRPQSRAILLYSDLPSLLAGIAKHGLERRIWARQLYAALANWTPLPFARDASQMVEKTDLQLAALAWLMQIQHFDEVASKYGEGRVMLLDSAKLVAEPRRTLATISDFLGLRFEDSLIDSIVSGPVLCKHSKTTGTRYSFDERNRDQAAAQLAYGSEIRAATDWLHGIARRHHLPLAPSFKASSETATRSRLAG